MNIAGWKHISFLDTFLVRIGLSVFEIDGRQHPVSRMFAFRVIEHFDVVEDVLSGVLTGFVKATPDAFAFEQVEEAFCDSVVMAVSTPTHRMFKVMSSQERGPVTAGVL